MGRRSALEVNARLESIGDEDDFETLQWAMGQTDREIRDHVEFLQTQIGEAQPNGTEPNPGLIESNEREIELLRWVLGENEERGQSICHCGEPAIGECPCCGEQICAAHMKRVALALAGAIGLQRTKALTGRPDSDSDVQSG